MNQPVRQWWGRPEPRIGSIPEPPKRGWVGAILAFVVVSGLLVAVFLFHSGRRMPAPSEDLNTRIQMKGFELAVRRYWHIYEQLPAGSMSNILAVLSCGNTDDQNPDKILFMKLRPAAKRFGKVMRYGDVDAEGNYLDGWGRPFLLRVDTNGTRMVITSLGPNGADDGGREDDISMLVLPKM